MMQGDPLAVVSYKIGVLPLIKRLELAYPGVGRKYSWSTEYKCTFNFFFWGGVRLLEVHMIGVLFKYVIWSYAKNPGNIKPIH